tara:strand:+ start:336 stop:1061 length:726 start_codon:yes stop_codon:yes gene_type:complete
VKDQYKVKKKRPLLLIALLLLTTFLTFRTFKKVHFQDISILGSEFFSIEDIVANSSLDFLTPLIFIRTKYIEKELKNNLSLEKVSVYRQLYPFGLKILIKTRTPIAYGERILNGQKINGFIDESGFFINKKYADNVKLKKLSTKVFGWKENFREISSKILSTQKNNDVKFVTINFSPNGFLTLKERSLKTILLGSNPKIIETQLQIIYDIKNQLKGRLILEKIDNIDLTDPSNPKIKVFKP